MQTSKVNPVKSKKIYILHTSPALSLSSLVRILHVASACSFCSVGMHHTLKKQLFHSAQIPSSIYDK